MSASRSLEEGEHHRLGRLPVPRRAQQRAGVVLAAVRWVVCGMLSAASALPVKGILPVSRCSWPVQGRQVAVRRRCTHTTSFLLGLGKVFLQPLGSTVAVLMEPALRMLFQHGLLQWAAVVGCGG